MEVEGLDNALRVADQEHDVQVDAVETLQLPRAHREVRGVDDVCHTRHARDRAIELFGDATIVRAQPPANRPLMDAKQRKRTFQVILCLITE